ncbi:nitric oxide reductase transcriptional regulator NorR [Catenovulum adriaticum]|uniref:Nitric oxide reductase transcriptional regulator NorR n=1 Tax=Catenovulum adriaticum TaxID=2984846 RepID=A0ABY7AKE6_9ALTE|nr:nitric oxide reductase transcriptional regulator NorR [Catenovulum sp. TS8]WAJ70023.1 nitric oxide reductase transcriptional regulator NorR [Catenovulum sp. TS8]
MPDIPAANLIKLALDLSNSLTSADRYQRLLSIICQTINNEAVVLLKYQGDQLVPLAQQGLTREVLGRRFLISEHPRLAQICQSDEPVRFTSQCDLPDPYDGMLLAQGGNLPVHACMGLPLKADDQLLGVLTLDSMTPHAFDEIAQHTLYLISAMSAATLKTAMRIQQLEHLSNHNQQVVAELTRDALTKDGGELIGDSPAMDKLKHEISLSAPSDFTILIEGETGTGKELVARTLHMHSTRKNGPLVYVNCAALPENLIESELFGHVKGAFTGADKNRTGKFSLANHGTIFLDEIGELPLGLQSKLLRALQNQEIQPVGLDKTEQLNVRVIAATNRQLKQEVEAGRFRADLYHRLSVFPITVPALRNRISDIPLLTGYFIEQVRRKLGIAQLVLSANIMPVFKAYSWPGNVRELEHTISRSALNARSNSRQGVVTIEISDIHLLTQSSVKPESDETVNTIDTTSNSKTQIDETREPLPSSANQNLINLRQATEQFQLDLITKTLAQNDMNWSATAKQLSTDRANLVRLAKRLGIVIKKQIM